MACVPAIVAVSLFIYFAQNNLFLWMLYPLGFTGFFPLLYALVNCGRVLPYSQIDGPVYLNQWFRFTVGTVTYLLFSISAVYIAYIARLVYVYPMASTAIILLSFASVLALLAQLASVQQRQSEALFRRFLVAPDSSLSQKDVEIDDAFSVSSRKMRAQVMQERSRIVSLAFSFLFGSFTCIVIAGYLFTSLLPTRFDIYESPTFSRSCINQTMLDGVANGQLLSMSKCLYPLCPNTGLSGAVFSIDPPLAIAAGAVLPAVKFYGGDLYVQSGDIVGGGSDVSSGREGAEGGGIGVSGGGGGGAGGGRRTRGVDGAIAFFARGCADYALLQQCDGFGYVGVVGTVKMGADCRCDTAVQQPDNSSECRKKKDVPDGFATVYLLFVLLAYVSWQSQIFDRDSTFRWTMHGLFVEMEKRERGESARVSQMETGSRLETELRNQ